MLKSKDEPLTDSLNEWVSERVTRSPIELSWTAENKNICSLRLLHAYFDFYVDDFDAFNGDDDVNDCCDDDVDTELDI